MFLRSKGTKSFKFAVNVARTHTHTHMHQGACVESTRLQLLGYYATAGCDVLCDHPNV